MTRALVTLALVVLGCSGNRPDTCTPEAREALTVLYEKAAVQAVESGSCDSSSGAETCPAVQALLVHMRVAQKAMCE